VQKIGYDSKPENEDGSGYDSESIFALPGYVLPIGYFDDDLKGHKSGTIDYGSMSTLEDAMKPKGLKPVDTGSPSLEDRLVSLVP